MATQDTDPIELQQPQAPPPAYSPRQPLDIAPLYSGSAVQNVEERELNFSSVRELLSTTRVTIAIETTGWLVALFYLLGKFIQLTTGSHVNMRVIREARRTTPDENV